MMSATYSQMSWKKLYIERMIKLMGQNFKVCPIFDLFRVHGKYWYYFGNFSEVLKLYQKL